jgi:hypothetical protein
MRIALLPSLLLVFLTGCATAEAPVVQENGVDRARMSIIEQQAAGRGVRVHWVNPPLKSPAR